MGFFGFIFNFIIFKSNLYLLFILPLIVYLLFKLFKLNLTLTSYKITNWFFTLFFCSFYICFFFLFILIFRIIRNFIDLYEIYIKLSSSVTTIKALPLFNQILILYTIIIFIIIWLLLFIKIYKICCNEWIKIHLYLYFKYMEKYQNLLNIIIYNFTVQGSLIQLNLKLLTPCQIKFYLKYPNNFLNNYFSKIIINLKRILKNIHWIILFILLYYDIFFNNYSLILTTKYLPIFMVFLLWHQISNFLQEQNPSFNKILAEQYYSKNIVYINLSKEEEQILLIYTKTFKDLNMASFENDANYLNPIIQLHRFVQIKDLTDKIYYYNEHIQLGFYPQDLIIKNSKYVVNIMNLRHMRYNNVETDDEY